jgi:hypothetical protein
MNWIYQNRIIKEDEYFIYEVLIYLHTKNSFSLHESKIYKSKQFIDNIIESSYNRYKDFTIEKEIQLIKAPINWLEKFALKSNDN